MEKFACKPNELSQLEYAHVTSTLTRSMDARTPGWPFPSTPSRLLAAHRSVAFLVFMQYKGAILHILFVSVFFYSAWCWWDSYISLHIDCSSSLHYGIPWCEYTVTYLTNSLLVGLWVVSTFELLSTVFLWVSKYFSFAFLLGVY